MIEIIKYVTSILGVIFFIISPLMKKKKYILMSQMGAALFYMINYIIIGATSGWLIEIVEEIKDFIIIKYEEHNKKVPIVLLITFIISLFVITIIAYNGISSIAPLVINIAYFISTYFKNPKYIRYTMFICAFIWMYYNYSVGAYIFIVGNVFEAIFALISINKYKNKTN